MTARDDVVVRIRAWWAWAWRPLVIALASRVFATILVLVLNQVRRRPVGNPFAVWDGHWYLGIARDGYHGYPVAFHPVFGQPWYDFAFFPAWPAVMKAGGLLVAPFELRIVTAATGLATLLFLAGSVVAWRVMADRLGPRAATAGLALLAFSPGAYAFSLVYAESLFLLLAAASFLAVGTVARPVFVGLAMLTRIAGAALVVAGLVEAVMTRGLARRQALAAAAGGIVAFGAWFAAIGVLTGDPLGFVRGSAGWNVRSGIVPQLARVVMEPSWEQVGWVLITVVAVGAAVLLLRRDRELGVFSLACLALVVLPGSVSHSWPRYILAAFPVFAVLGERVQDRFGRAGLIGMLIVFAVGQVVFAAWTIPSPNIAP